jgi:hypothetical protein
MQPQLPATPTAAPGAAGRDRSPSQGRGSNRTSPRARICSALPVGGQVELVLGQRHQLAGAGNGSAKRGEIGRDVRSPVTGSHPVIDNSKTSGLDQRRRRTSLRCLGLSAPVGQFSSKSLLARKKLEARSAVDTPRQPSNDRPARSNRLN